MHRPSAQSGEGQEDIVCSTAQSFITAGTDKNSSSEGLVGQPGRGLTGLPIGRRGGASLRRRAILRGSVAWWGSARWRIHGWRAALQLTYMLRVHGKRYAFHHVLKMAKYHRTISALAQESEGDSKGGPCRLKRRAAYAGEADLLRPEWTAFHVLVLVHLPTRTW